jgi:hypothetical protein
MFATVADCSFVIVMMDFEPAECGIDHNDTFAYKVCLSFSVNGIWANVINVHLIPRYCSYFFFWEVSTLFGSLALFV